MTNAPRMTELSEIEWNAYAAEGERQARSMLVGTLTSINDANADVRMLVAFSFGVIRSTASLLRQISVPSSHDQVEHMALAIMRGTMRGKEGPVGEDGELLP